MKNRKRDKRKKEGVSKWGMTCFCLSFIPLLAVDGGSFSMGVTPGRVQRERIRAYFLKLLLGRGKCSAAV